MQGMHQGLLYILQGIKPRTFEELATRAYDMKISTANHGGQKLPIVDQHRDKKEWKKGEKPNKALIKESMAVTTIPIKVPVKKKREEGQKQEKPYER